MQMMNRAIEDAAVYEDFRKRLCQTSGDSNFLKDDSGDRRFFVIPQRLLGENRATYRARVKAERREAKQVKA
jgi:predicted P-loop ATPase